MSFCRCSFFSSKAKTILLYRYGVYLRNSVYSNKEPTYKYKVSTKASGCSAKGIGDIDFGLASLLIKMGFA